jgi:3-oxoadipate enol-lactonase
MAQAIPGATYQVIPGVGHLANLERPEAFNAVLEGFLADLPS